MNQRSQAAAAPGVTETNVDVEQERDSAIETLGAILRSCGRHAFDVGERSASEISQELEGWASHILVFTPAPGEPRSKRRAFAKLRQAFASHRASEEEFVRRTVGGMRDATWELLTLISRSVSDDTANEQALSARMEKLKTVAVTGSLEDLRRDALAAAEAVSVALSQQRARHKTQAVALTKRLAAMRSELEDAKREGATDPLTKVANRRAFDAELERVIVLTGAARIPATVLLVDVDHFKAVNDTHGHAVGDVVLCRLADTLVRSFPRRTDLVARYGGEEFGVILGETALSEAEKPIARLLNTVRSLVVNHANANISITVSVGAALVWPGDKASDVLERADAALYESKHGGRDRVTLSPGAPSSRNAT